MNYDLTTLKIPKDIDIFEHRPDELIIFRKGHYLMTFEKKEYTKYIWNKESTEKDYRFYIKILKDNKVITHVGTSDISNEEIEDALKKLNQYPSIEDEMIQLEKPIDIVKPLGIDLHSYGVTGTIRKYMLYPCVIAYAMNIHACYMIIKMKKGGLKGIRFIGGKKMYGYQVNAHEYKLEHIMEMISEIRQNQVRYLEPDEKHQQQIIAEII